jgi:predicted RNase H-like nuclease (RuvC/YqgF family)
VNANELIDWLENHVCGAETTKEVIAMLRQQKAEIESLKKLLEHSVGSDCREMRYIQEIENKDAEIEALKAELDEANQRYWNNK